MFSTVIRPLPVSTTLSIYDRRLLGQPIYVFPPSRFIVKYLHKNVFLSVQCTCLSPLFIEFINSSTCGVFFKFTTVYRITMFLCNHSLPSCDVVWIAPQLGKKH